MRLFLLGSLLLLQLLLGGCAYLTSFSSDLPSKIDSLIKQQKYGEALDILDYVKPTDKNHTTLMQQKKHVEKLAAQLESNTIKTGQQYIKQNEWYKAQLTYEQALNKLPQSKKLQAAEKQFLATRKEYLEKLELAMTLNNANWLILNAPVQKEMERVLPHEYERYPALRNYQQQVDETAKKLNSCLSISLEEKNYELTRTCLDLARRIGSPEIDKTQLAKAQKKLASVEKSYVRKRNKTTRNLIAELKQGYSHDNLGRARQQLDLLKQQQTTNPETLKLQNDLEILFRKGIDQGIAGGRRQYSQGHVKEAMQIWTALQQIDPGNQKLEEHIDRAERVLEKLNRLSEDNSTVNLPAN